MYSVLVIFDKSFFFLLLAHSHYQDEILNSLFL